MLQCKNRKKFYLCITSRCNTHPNNFICTYGHNATQAKKMWTRLYCISCTCILYIIISPLPFLHYYSFLLEVFFYPVRVCAAGLCVWLCRFVYVCMYICGQKTGCLGSYHLSRKFPVSATYLYCLGLTAKKGTYYVIYCEKKIGTITGWKKGLEKLYFGKPCLIYMQFNNAMLTNAERQHTTAVQTYNITNIPTGTVCTDSAQSAQGTCSVEL